MKYLLMILTIALVGCTSIPVKVVHLPKFKINDCISMTLMTMTKEGGWDSSGYSLAHFQIVDIVTTDKMNTYMAERLHAKTYYKTKLIFIGDDDKAKYHKDKTYVVPIEDLDSYRYASVFWYPEGQSKLNCNSYRKESK